MRLGEQKQCMDGYRRILSLLPIEEGEHFMQLSKDMAKYRTHIIHVHTSTTTSERMTHIKFSLFFRSYYESNDLAAALGIIEEALDRHPGLVSDDFVNMAAELNIAKHQYCKAIQVQVHMCDWVGMNKTVHGECRNLSVL